VIEAALSEEGRRVLAQGLAAIVEVEAQVTAGLSAAALDSLDKALRQCRDNATAQR
jgi:hypothetical protein